MSVQAPAEAAPVTVRPPWLPPRRAVSVFLVALTVIAGGLAGNALWTAQVDEAAESIAITTSWPECTGTQVTTLSDEHEWDDMDGLPAPKLRSGMDCLSTLTITNDGSRAVKLESLELLMRGPAEGASVDADEVLDAEGPLSTLHDSDARDYLASLDRPLAAGASLDLVVRHKFARGCTSQGHFWTSAGSVRLKVLRQVRDVESSEPVVWRGTRESSCGDS